MSPKECRKIMHCNVVVLESAKCQGCLQPLLHLCFRCLSLSIWNLPLQLTGTRLLLHCASRVFWEVSNLMLSFRWNWDNYDQMMLSFNLFSVLSCTTFSFNSLVGMHSCSLFQERFNEKLLVMFILTKNHICTLKSQSQCYSFYSFSLKLKVFIFFSLVFFCFNLS